MQEWWNALRLAPRQEHVLCQVVLVVFLPVVLAEEDLDGAPRGLDGVRVSTGVEVEKGVECDTHPSSH